MRMVEDPRSPRAKKHDLAEVLVCLIAGYVTHHTSLHRVRAWCCRHINWLRKCGMKLKNGIASVPTISRLLSNMDYYLFLYAFMEWVGEILNAHGHHITIDGKALRGALSKVEGGPTPILLNALDAATGLVLAQLPIDNKDCEITEIPQLLKLLNIRGKIVTVDAIGTQTNIMQQIIDQDGHFVMTVKKNQPNSYDELVKLFAELEADARHKSEGKIGFKHYDLLDKYDSYSTSEKNRDRNEIRICQVCSDPSYVTKTQKEWTFLSTIGVCKQLRILRVRDTDGNDVTPDKKEFLQTGSVRQPRPVGGDQTTADYQIVGMVSDLPLSAKEMAQYKRSHWCIENTLHHALDDSFREDRSPAKKSRNNLALIRKFAYNILRLVSVQMKIHRPNTELMDLLCDDPILLRNYIFREISPLS